MALIRFRRGTEAQWATADPTLAQGEPGYETDTGLVKIGDGTSSWSDLDYLTDTGGGGGTGDMAAATYDPTGVEGDAFARANHTGTQSADSITDGTTNKAYTAAEKTKLGGVAAGATLNSSDAALVARGNHTGTESADVLTDGTTNKAYTATERTKLGGVATGATANDTDANLKARANHTGTQLAATISDFSTAADARVAAAVGTTVQAFDADLTAFAAKTAPTGAVVGTTDTQTLTNKRVTRRVDAQTTGGASYAFNADSFDAAKITAQNANLTLANPTGTPTAMQSMLLRIKDDGTARTIAYGTQFRALGVTLPTTTVLSKTLYLGAVWNSDDSKWDVLAVGQEA